MMFLFADIWCSNDEQCAMSLGLLGARICEGIDMGLFFRSVGYSHRLHCHGRLRQFPHSFPSMDINTCYPALSFLPGIGLCSWLSIWVVIDQMLLFYDVLYVSFPSLGCIGDWERLCGYSFESFSRLWE
jgi:hypothetical protein